MKTYIVEDDILKRERLAQFMKDRFSSAEVSIFGSYQSGLKAVEAAAPDLLLLDMTLPTFDRSPGTREGRLRPQGGYDMLSKIKLKSIKTKVIVVTGLTTFGESPNARISFKEIEGLCQKEFGGIFCGMVYYQQMNLEWQATLENFILATIQ